MHRCTRCLGVRRLPVRRAQAAASAWQTSVPLLEWMAPWGSRGVANGGGGSRGRGRGRGGAASNGGGGRRRGRPRQQQHQHQQREHQRNKPAQKAQHRLSTLEDSIIDAALKSALDLTEPHLRFPVARLMKRRIVFHGGPTNSGKTYQALQRLKQARGGEHGIGVYCGPLRLLAAEVYDSLNREGIVCDLVTGQEKRLYPCATHVSCTVEAVDLSKTYDVAVVDEIQMIADRDRGDAWTRILHGLRCKEIHLCGGAEARDLVKDIAEAMGDDFEFSEHQRLAPLIPEEQSLEGDYSRVQPGDCVVAFTRADLFSIKHDIESHTPHRCAIIYGQLPPEARTHQARLFNEPDTGYDILLASDAVGMGLNLNIGRIIFHSVIKFSGGEGVHYAPPMLVKQIAGRAGRAGSRYNEGKVTTWQPTDLPYVKECIKYELPQLSRAGVFLSTEQVDHVATEVARALEGHVQRQRAVEEEGGFVVPDEKNSQTSSFTSSSSSSSSFTSSLPTSFTSALLPSKSSFWHEQHRYRLPEPLCSVVQVNTVVDRFIQQVHLGNRYFLCRKSGRALSNFLHPVPLSLHDRFLLYNIPVPQETSAMHDLYRHVATQARGFPVHIGVHFVSGMPRVLSHFSDLCDRFNSLLGYSWLSQQFPSAYVQPEHAASLREGVLDRIHQVLHRNMIRHMSMHERSDRERRAELAGKDPPLKSGEMPPPPVYGNMSAPRLKVGGGRRNNRDTASATTAAAATPATTAAVAGSPAEEIAATTAAAGASRHGLFEVIDELKRVSASS